VYVMCSSQLAGVSLYCLADKLVPFCKPTEGFLVNGFNWKYCYTWLTFKNVCDTAVLLYLLYIIVVNYLASLILLTRFWNGDTLPNNVGPSWPWTYCSWIYNYLCNQCLSPLKLWVRTSFMASCTRYNIMWLSWSVTCGRSVVFSGYSGFIHQ
jgi:hypothetical protein